MDGSFSSFEEQGDVQDWLCHMTATFVNSNGVRLWTISQGVGSPVLLCNGGPGCCDYLAPMAQMLQETARRFTPKFVPI
jgi:hypothetical protein